MLLALAAIWGASYMFIAIGIRDLSPVVVAWGRVALAALVVVPIAAARHVLGSPRGHVRIVVLVGVVQVALPFLLISTAQQAVPSSLAGTLVASSPLFTALLAIRVDHEERSQGMRLVGVMLGLAGVAVLLGLDLAGSLAELAGGLAILLASLGYATGGLVLKHRLAGLPAIAVTAWVMIVSTVALLPAAVVAAPDGSVGAGPLAAVAALGVLGTGLAFVIFYGLIARVGPARSFIVTYLAPAFAVLYGVALLGEGMTVATVAGLVLIVSGASLAVEGRLPGAARALPGSAPRPAPSAGPRAR